MGSGFKDFAAGDILTAADVDGYLMRQTVMTFADASARDSALSGVLDEGMCAYLEDTNELTAYDGSAWVVYAGRGYQYVQTVYFTTSGSFTKATYPWLRAVRIRLVGGGGGSGGVAATTSPEYAVAHSGAGGGYAEAFVLASALSASETVTVGAGGTAGAAGNNAGGDGGASSFGAHCAADGGTGGSGGAALTVTTVLGPRTGGNGTTGDLFIHGEDADSYLIGQTESLKGPQPGGSALAGARGGNATTSSAAGVAGRVYGAGAAGALNRSGTRSAQAGAVGGDGIVIVELYA